MKVTFVGGFVVHRRTAAPGVVGAEPRELVVGVLGEPTERGQTLALEDVADGEDDQPVEVEALAVLLAQVGEARERAGVDAVGDGPDRRVDRIGFERPLRVRARTEDEVGLRVEPAEVPAEWAGEVG